MPEIKIVTDSTSDLPPQIAAEEGITIVPLNVFFGDESFKDRVNLSPEAFYSKVSRNDSPWPSTVHPSPDDFANVYKEIFDEGYEAIISIHISSEMSKTVSSAEKASKAFPEKEVHVLDSLTATLPLGMIVYHANKLVQAGRSVDFILAAISKNLRNKTRIVSVLDSLEYLHRGGRIGYAKKFFGKLLDKKPLLTIRNGKVDSIGSYTGRKEVLDSLTAAAKKVLQNMDVPYFWVGFTDDRTIAQDLVDRIGTLPGAPNKIELIQIGPTVGTHLGTGAVALTYIGNWMASWFD